VGAKGLNRTTKNNNNIYVVGAKGLNRTTKNNNNIHVVGAKGLNRTTKNNLYSNHIYVIVVFGGPV
jgi:hypothetical protein